MSDLIISTLFNTEGIHIVTLVLNNVVAFAAAFFLMFVYKITFSGAAYSEKFNISLGMLVVITTSIMCVISNNVALSLGMVGALSIIRFRTAVKDVRDAAFIFWAIAMGIGCGVSQFLLVGCGALCTFIFLMATRQIIPDNRKLLIIRGELRRQNTIERQVTEYFGNDAHQVVKSAAGDSFELVYGIQGTKLVKANDRHKMDIVQSLMNTEGVTSANLVEQTDDISR